MRCLACGLSFFSPAMGPRAAFRTTILFQLSRLPSRNMTNRALDPLLLTERRSNPSVKSVIRPTFRVMMVWLIVWPTTWQLVDKLVKYLAPSVKWTRSQGMGWMRVNGSQVTSRAIVEESHRTVTVERLCLEKNPPSRNRLLVSWWMDNSSSTVTTRVDRLVH